MSLFIIKNATEINDKFIKSLRDECQQDELLEYKRDRREIVAVFKDQLPKDIIEDIKQNEGPFSRKWYEWARQNIEEVIGKKVLFSGIESKKFLLGVIMED